MDTTTILAIITDIEDLVAKIRADLDDGKLSFREVVSLGSSVAALVAEAAKLLGHV